MIYNTFTTKEEADAAQEQDYQLFIAGKSPEYAATTQRWEDVIELPGGWGYIPYPKSDHVYNTIDFTPPKNGFSA